MKNTNILIELLHNKGVIMDKTLNNRLSINDFKVLFYSMLIFFAVYGAIIGMSHSLPQSLASTIKVPILFLLTTAISFPALYFFLAILGLKQTFYQLASFTVVCLTIISGVLIVFAPISFFFLVTTTNYVFFKLLNIAIFAVAGFVGIYIFYKNINIEIEKSMDRENKSKLRLFLRLWFIMFGFIGAQLSYTLSPFFGDPTKSFIFFTELQRNFFTDILASFSGIY